MNTSQSLSQILSQRVTVNRLLTFISTYFTFEDSITTHLIEELINQQLYPSLNFKIFEKEILELKKFGLLSEEPDSRIIKINPLYSFNLKKNLESGKKQKIQNAIHDYYSGYALSLIHI